MRQLLLIFCGCVLLLAITSQLSLAQPNNIIEIDISSTDSITVDKGTTVRLICISRGGAGPYTYQWIIQGTSGVISTEMVLEVTPNETTTYVCAEILTSGDGTVTRQFETITIIIPDPPVIATPDQPSVTDSGIEVMIGNDTCINNTFMGMVNFTCVIVSGMEPITFNWLVGGEDFMNNGHSVVIPINNTASKLIVGVDTGASVDLDLNNYTCIANNADGSDTASSILSRCEVPPVIETGNITIECPLSEGNIGGNYSNITEEQVIIYCRLIDGFPLPNISWFYMGSELIMFRNSSEINRTVDNDTIGEYTCVATNALGMDSATSFVDIQFPPMINRSLGLMNNVSIDLYEINVGEDPFVEVPFNITNVILYCVVSGREMPTVNWTTPISLDNDTFTIETFVEMDELLFVVTSLFNISNFTNDYAGLYLCNASNCAGQDGSGVSATQQEVYFVGFSSTRFSGSEGSTSSVSLFVSQPAPFDISLTLQASDITAMFNTDYFFMAGSTDRNIDVVIPMGSTTSDVSFTVRNDTIVELDETFQLQISLSMESVDNDVLLAGSSAAVVTLEDSRSFSVMVAFTQSSFTGVESTGSLSASLELIGGTFSTQLSVAVTPSQQTPVSAEGSLDFDTAIQTATFAEGTTMATVSIPLIADNIVEMDEEFVIAINQPTVRGLTLGTLSMTTGIIRDSTIVDVQFSQERFIGSEASGFVMVSLELSGGTSASPFTVMVTPSQQSPVSAEGGVDFNTTTLTATFDSGMTMSSVRVPVISDTSLERDETFDLALNISSSAGRGITLGSRSTALGVITDSTMLTVEFASGQFTGSESSEFIEVIVRIADGSSSTPITVTVTPSEQSPVSAEGSGVDYNSDPFNITINAGATEGRANISVTCDDEVEGSETFDMRLTLTSGSNGVTLGRDTSVGEIMDSTVAVSFNQSSYGVMEDDGTVSLVIALSQPSSVPFEVTIETVDMTASSGGDYIGGTRQINVSPQTTTQSFTLPIINDETVECVETFGVVIISVTTCGVTISNNRTEVMITDDDGATVSLSEPEYSVAESDTPLTVTIIMSNRASEDVVVEVTLSDGSADAGVDYAMSSPLMFNVTISGGSLSQSFDVDIINDMIQEDNETFNIAIRLLPSCLSLSLGTSSSTVTIIDNDVAMITFSSSTFSGTESSGVISATVIISGGIVSSRDITVPITFTEGTATGSNVDFNSTTQNAIISAGTNSSTVNIAVTNDNIVEGDEMFTMNLNVPVSPGIIAGTNTMATATIIDTSMIRVRFTQDQFTGSELEGFVEVFLELNQGSSTSPFTVMVTPSEQSPVSAEGGVDFNNATLTATFSSGMRMSSVRVPVINDSIVEGSERFNLMLTVPPSLAPAIAAGNRNTAVGVITDSTMLVVEFASGQFTGSESSGFIEVIVRVTGGSSSTPITVTVTPSEQSPVSAMGMGIDFDSNPFNVTIAAGSIEGRRNISVALDDEVEPLETFDLSLSVVTSSSQIMLGRDTSVGQIIDSTVVVNFDQPSYSVMEGDDAVIVSITLSQSSSMNIEVDINTMDVTATDVEDYDGGQRTVIIPAGETTRSFMINIPDDSIAECSESFNLEIVAVRDGGVIIGSVNNTEVIIMDDDGATVSLSEPEYSVAESDTSLSVTIMLSNRASEDVVVEVTLSDGSADAGVDYAMSSSLMFNVTISAGSLSQSFDVDIINDMIQEDNETFNIAIRLLPSCLSLSLGTSSSTVTIIDNDVAMITFSSSTFSGTESSGVISATVIISGRIVSSRDITVPITFTEGTATGENEDFDSTAQNAIISAGTNSSTVNITVTNDNIVEGDEMFTMNLNVPVSPGIIAGAVTMASATIIDTSMIRVRFTQDQFTGSELEGFVEVLLELNQGSSTSPFTVMVTPSEQSPVSAEGGVDFNTTTLTATFGSGMTMSSVRVPVINDNVVEGSERFNLMLTVPSSLAPAIRAGGRNTAVGVITDSTMLVVEFASGQFTGSESSEFIEVVVRVTGGSSSTPITVTVTPSEQSPVSALGSGVDYNSDPFNITINAGATEGRANISVTCDDEVEGSETFDMRLTLTSGSNGVTLGRDTSVGEIMDSTVVVSFNQSSYEVMEDDGTVSLVIALSQPSSVPFEVSIGTMDGSAVDGPDYSSSMEMISIPPGVMTQSFTISITDDNLVECVETFTVRILSVTTCGVTVGSVNSAQVRIIDDDRATVSLSEPEYSVAESDTSLPVTIMLSNRASEDVVVEVTLSDGSADAGVDYAMSSPLMFNVTISGGSLSQSFDVDIINDMIQEANETFNIAIRLLPSCLSLSLGTSSSTVTIIDNDVAMITFSSSTFSGTESSGVISATVIISGGIVSSRDITVPITFTEGTATGNDVDFNSTMQNAIIIAGDTSSSVNISVTNDNIVEGDEMFTMNLNVPVSPGIVAGAITMATATIIDTSTLNVIFTQNQFSGSEATEFVQVNLELVGGTSANSFDVTVTPSELSPVSAEGGVDFETAPQTATFATGMSMSDVTILVFVDNIAEGPENFNLTLTVPMNLGPAITAGSRNSALGVITDSTRLIVEFTSARFTGMESSEFIEVVVRIRMGQSNDPITVTVTPSEQSPLSAMGSGVDFNSDPFNITIVAGATEGRANISVTCDDEVEGSETFDMRLSLASSSNGVTLGRDTSVGEIIDSTVAVSFSRSSYEVMEDNGTVSLVIALSQPSSVPFEVSIDTMNVTAVDGEDYSGIMRMITISPGVMTRSITISITDDNLVECVETFTVRILSVTTCGVTVGSVRNAEVRIIDDDRVTVSLSEPEYSVAESDTPLPVTIMLSNRASEDVVVEVTLSDGSANAGVDYAMSSPLMFNVTISAGSLSQSFDVDIINDMIQENNETFNIAIRLLPSCLSLSLGTSSSTVTIIDNDVAMITFSSSTFSGTESSGVISATVIISGGIVSSEDITVPVSFSSGNASGGIDYDSRTQNVRIIAGTSSQPVNIAVLSDNLVEGNETFEMNLNVPTTPGVVPGAITTATGIILDSTNVQVAFSRSRVVVMERTGSVPLNLILTGGIFAEPFSVFVTATEQSPVSAEGDVDFDASTQTATFRARDTSSRVTIPIVVDDIVEAQEEFIVTIVIPPSSEGITLGDPSTAVVAIDDTTRITVEFSESMFSGSEFSGEIVVGLQLDGGRFVSPSIVNVTVTATPRSATGNGVDFVSEPLIATFMANSTTASVSFPIVLDDIEEPDETFDVSLMVPSRLAPSIQAGSPRLATATITDSTVLVSLSQSMYRVDEDDGSLMIIISLSRSSSESIMVTVNTSDITANVDEDYGQAGVTSYSAVFPPGSTMQSITIPIINDNVREGNETFRVTINPLSIPGVILGANDTAVITIIETTEIAVRFSRGHYEATEVSGQMEVEILLVRGFSSVPVNVTVRLRSGSATAGVDFDSTLLTGSIPAGENSTNVSVPIMQDNIIEQDEMFILDLRLPIAIPGITLGSANRATGTIIDSTVQVSFENSSYSVMEGSSVVITVVLSSMGSQEYTVNIRSRDNSATAGSDYDDGQIAPVTFPVGTVTQSFSVNTLSDNIYEFNETFSLFIQPPSTLGLSVGSPMEAQVTIVDNTMIQVEFSTPTFMGTEMSRSVPVSLVITNGSIARSFSVSVQPSQLTPPSATSADFDTTAITAEFDINNLDPLTSNTRVPVVMDTIVEGPEMFGLSVVSNIPQVTIGPRSTATGVIIDSTTARVQFTRRSYSGDEASGFVNVSVTLSGGTSANPFTVMVTPSEQSPVSAEGGVDFNTTTLTATFDSGMTMSSVRVPVIADDELEPTEQFDLTLSMPSQVGIRLGSRTSATGNIIDSTVTVNFQQPTYTTREDSRRRNIQLLLSSRLSEPISVVILAQNMSAIAGIDYEVPGGGSQFNVDIPAGTESRLFSVDILDDNLLERTEIFRLTIIQTNSTIVTAGNTPTADIIITDDEALVVGFSAQSFAGREISGGIIVNLNITGGIPSQPIRVDIRPSESAIVSARAGSDFDSTPRSATFDPGNTTSSVTIPVFLDNMLEGNETFTLDLNVRVPRVTTSSSRDTATGIIVDSTVAVSFQRANYSINENSVSPLRPGLMLNQPFPNAVNVIVRAQNASALAGSDYGPEQSYPVTFSPGSIRESFDVNIISDNVLEPDEIFLLNITMAMPPNGVIIGQPDSAEVTIIETTVLTVEFESATYSAREGQGLSIAVVLSGGTFTSDILVSVTPSEQRPVSAQGGGIDFISRPVLASFVAGRSRATTSISLVCDRVVEGNEELALGLSVLSPASGVTVGSQSTATAIIMDATIEVAFVSNSSRVNEDVGTATIPLMVSPLSTQQIRVSAVSTGNSATGGEDYGRIGVSDPQTFSATIPPNSARGNLPVAIIDDNTFESEEEFTLTLQLPQQCNVAISGQITTNITIVDNDIITVQFAERQYFGTESSRMMMVRVVITGGSSSSVVMATVQPSQLSPVSANGGGVDFDSDPVVATFQPNQDSTTVRIPLVCDTEIEGDERFNITLNASLPVILGARSTAIGVIEDSTVAVSFGMASYSFPEDDTSASVDITLNQAHNAPLSVDVISEDLTAIARMDYSRIQSRIPIPAGSRSVSVLVNIIDDNNLEQTETFRLNITRLLTGGFCGATIGRMSTEVSITDNDVVTVQFQQPQFTGTEESQVLIATVVLSGGTVSFPFAVTVTSSSRTAIAGNDFDGMPITVVFSPGDQSREVRIPLVCDTNVEDTETFLMSLSINATNSRLRLGTQRTAIGNIEDSTVAVSFSSPNYDVQEGRGLVQLEIELSQETSQDFIIMASTMDGTATAPQDYSSRNQPLLISRSSTSSRFSIPITNDRILEDDEQFSVSLQLPTDALACGITLGSISMANVTILDNEVLTVQFSRREYVGTESSGLLSVELMLSGGIPSVPFNVTVISSELSPPSAIGNGVDFDSNPRTATFDPSTFSTDPMIIEVQIPLTRDTEIEEPESFSMVLMLDTTNPSIRLGGINTARGTIEDSTVFVQFDMEQYSVGEEDGSVEIKLILNEMPGVAMNATVTTADLTANSGSDYVGGQYLVQFSASEETKALMIGIIDNNIVESTEMFQLRLTADGQLAVGNRDIATVVITDNEDVSVNFTNNTFSATEVSGIMPVNLMLSGGVFNTSVTVSVTTMPQSATAGIDYNPDSVDAVFAAFDTSATVGIPILLDNEAEEDEQFGLAIAIPSELNTVLSLGNPSDATGIITDSSVSVEFQFRTYQYNESESPVQPMLVLSRPLTVDVTVELSSENLSASAGIDFRIEEGPIVIPANTTTYPIMIEILNDNVFERSETFRLNVMVPRSSAELGLIEGDIPSTRVTINNDDGRCRNVTPCNGTVVVPRGSTCSICAVWQVGPFGMCMPDCHLGNRTREVICVDRDNTQTVVEDFRCDDSARPPSVEQCGRGPCMIRPRWRRSRWSTCTRTCEGGEQRRRVFCFSQVEDRVLPDDECDSAIRPRSSRLCNQNIRCECIDLYPTYCSRIMGTAQCMIPEYHQACCMSCAGAD